MGFVEVHSSSGARRAAASWVGAGGVNGVGGTPWRLVQTSGPNHPFFVHFVPKRHGIKDMELFEDTPPPQKKTNECPLKTSGWKTILSF